MFQLRQGDSPSLGGVLHAGGRAGRERGGEGGSGRWEDSGQVGIHSILLQEDVPFPCGPHRQTSQLQYLQDRPEGIVNDFVTYLMEMVNVLPYVFKPMDQLINPLIYHLPNLGWEGKNQTH